MYGEYTSLQITLTSGVATLPSGANGAIILDYTGALLGIVQTGNVDSAAPGTIYANTISGIKGRYIHYFLNNLAAVTALPTLGASYSSTRGIATNKRTPANLPGGITTNALGSASSSEQIVALTSAEYPDGFGLGSLGQNTPSFTDSLLHIKAEGGSLAVVYSADPGGTIIYAATAYLSATSLWRGGVTPNSLSVLPGDNAKTTQFVASSSQGGIGIAINDVLLNNLGNVKSGEFIAMTNGAKNSITEQQYDAVLVAGDATAVSGWLVGLPFTRPGWEFDTNYKLVYPAGSILVVIGGLYTDGTFFTQSNYYTSSFGVVSGVFGVALNPPNQLAVTYSVGSLSLTSNFTGVYNTWYYITTVNTTNPLNPLPLQLNATSSLSTITYASGTPSAPISISSTSADPTPIY
jgi:hypothetical protein